MNYNNYELKIVEELGVELIGWPTNLLPIRNPGHVGARDRVLKLLNALTTKACHWEKLSEEERQRRIILNGERHARGEQVYKPRKKHALQGTKKSAATIPSDTDSNSDGDDVAWSSPRHLFHFIL